MSERQTDFEPAIAEDQYQKFQFTQATQLIGRLQFGDQPLGLPNREVVELMSTKPDNGTPGIVLRHRLDKLDPLSSNRGRQDIYYAFLLGRTGVEPMLSVLRDDLVVEQGLIDDGEFEKIKPHREQQAQQALLFPNSLADVRLGEHEDIHQFVELLHTATSAQHAQATSVTP